jgi:FAD/FMN-containing dehydrogenase
MHLTTDESVRLTFARDVSGLELVPEAVARPTSEREVVEVLRQARAERTPVTCAGGQTSTTGASITDKGIALAMRGLDGVIDLDERAHTVRVRAGTWLGELKRQLAASGYLFPPDPTSEDDVTIGGAIACNASGARSLRYGPIRRHVRALRVALATGDVIDVRRSGLEKNTAGYAIAQEPVDWFVGSEGTLGVILEAELSLLHLPKRVMGLGIPFPSETEALAFVVAARESRALSPRCLEFFDARAFAIARAARGDDRWASSAGALVYAEEAPPHGVDAEPPLDEWLALAAQHAAREDDVLAFDGESALRDARQMRHAVPATMNERGASFRSAGGRKVSTDWAVPYRRLHEAIHIARTLADDAAIEQAVTYGHAGNGHPHQNFVARDADELARVERVVEATLREVISLGGTVSAEHGIGKIKRKWLPLQLHPAQLGIMRAVKRELDPLGILAPGNVFE